MTKGRIWKEIERFRKKEFECKTGTTQNENSTKEGSKRRKS